LNFWHIKCTKDGKDFFDINRYSIHGKEKFMVPKKVRISLIVLLLIITIFFSSCVSKNEPLKNQVSIPGLEITLAVQTMVARPELMHILISATPTTIPTTTPVMQEQDSQSSDIVEQSQGNNIPISSLTPIPTEDLCKNSAKFIQDITIPDYSMIKPRETFVKTWRFENNGTCPWTADYAIVFLSGEQMGGESPTPIGQLVLPGEQVDISINLTAPYSSSAYKGNWIFITSDGNSFGTGFEASNPFWVAIDVKTEKGKSDYIEQAKGGCGPKG
jgi:hypothetical protein